MSQHSSPASADVESSTAESTVGDVQHNPVEQDGQFDGSSSGEHAQTAFVDSGDCSPTSGRSLTATGAAASAQVIEEEPEDDEDEGVDFWIPKGSVQHPTGTKGIVQHPTGIKNTAEKPQKPKPQ